MTSVLKSKIDGAKVVDSLGRTITLRQPTIIDRLRAVESLNFKSKELNEYLNVLLRISTIKEGDDIFLIPHPINDPNEFYAMTGKIKDEGFNAAVRFINDHTDSLENGDEAVKK